MPPTREVISERNRVQYLKNREKRIEYAKTYYAENRDAVRKQRLAYHEANKERRNAESRAWYQRNKEKVSARNRIYNEKKRFRTHGLPEEKYLEMLEAQGGVCAICVRLCDVDGEKMSIDHCHNSGKIRGLLCKRCNSGLGFFRDSSDVLAKAIAYLDAA